MWQFDDHEICPEQATAEIDLSKDLTRLASNWHEIRILRLFRLLLLLRLEDIVEQRRSPANGHNAQ
jgi:hypothetical protein